MNTEQTLTDLTCFQQALTDHIGWLQRWYQAVLHHGDIPGPDAADCPFETWYRQAAMGPFGDCDAFSPLGQAHDAVHGRAAQITERVLAGHTVTTSDFESLMASVLAFGSAAQAVEREVWTVLASLDPLTGLANRRAMLNHLVSERDRAIRQRLPLCVALADIDHFKKINDVYGHLRGDGVLRQVAGILSGGVRPYDTVYRYGGEEFLLCLPGTTLEAGAQILERLRQSIATILLDDGSGAAMPVTATFGLAEIRADVSVEDGIEHADRALYDGKRAGRNRVALYGLG